MGEKWQYQTDQEKVKLTRIFYDVFDKSTNPIKALCFTKLDNYYKVQSLSLTQKIHCTSQMQSYEEKVETSSCEFAAES